MGLLSPNFSEWELTRSAAAIRLGLDNTPTKTVRAALRALAREVLQPTRNGIGRPIHVTSGYRSPSVNKAVGGDPNSQHMRGEAADIESWGVDNMALARWIADPVNRIPFDELILEFYDGLHPNSGWVHVSHRPGGPQRGRVLTARKVISQKQDKRIVQTIYLNGIVPP